MDFNDYVQGLTNETSPEGDFARDWDQDRTKPTVDTWDDLYWYLKGRNACPEAIESAEKLFKQWR